MKINPRLLSVFAIGTVLMMIAGIIGRSLIRPFDVPEYQEIDTSDSAFLIPLEGDLSKQQVFPSVDFLNEQKIAAKRVQIPHSWQQTGYFPGNGQFVAMVRLVKVDRKPVTREWTRSHASGTSARDEAVSAESKDSINFTMGVTCTANIPEEMAATFLYTYPSKSLAEIMDSEIRARVQQVIAEEAAGYPFSELLGKKTEIMVAVRADVMPYFETRGIKIGTLGMLGGIQFENPEIQRAIDEGVKAQQQKIVAEAKREAQEVENQRLKIESQAQAENEAFKAESEAKLKRILAVAEVESVAAKSKAEASAKKEVAQLEAEAESIKSEAQVKSRLRIAEAEAESLKKQAEARVYELEKATKAGAGEVLIKLRQMELEATRWKQWDGKIPAMPMWPGMGSPFASIPALMLPAINDKAVPMEVRK
jgi:SPFH domain / Band 7 family